MTCFSVPIFRCTRLVHSLRQAFLLLIVTTSAAVWAQTDAPAANTPAKPVTPATPAAPRVLSVQKHELRSIERVHPLAQEQWEAMNARLQTLVADPKNDFAYITQNLTLLYRSFGYPVAQVVADDADIEAAFSTGVLRWRVLEGLYGRIEVKAETKLEKKAEATAETTPDINAETKVEASEAEIIHTKSSGIANATLQRLKLTLSYALCGKASVAPAVCTGEVIQTQKAGLERGLLLANEIPNTRVDMPQFSAGQDVGQADLTFKAYSRDTPHALALEHDNYGSAATGVMRTSLTYTASNVLGWGEQFSYNRVQTNSNQSNDSYLLSLPVGHDGWRVALAQAQMQYTLSGGFAGVAKGQSETQTLSATYPLIRRFDRTVRLNTSYSKTKSETSYQEGLLLTHNNSNRYSLSIQEDLDDISQSNAPFLPSHTLWNIGLTHGRAQMDAESLAADQSGPKAAGAYTKLTYSVMRKQSLDEDNRWSLNVLLRGQLASKNLTGSEKQSLGGVSGVRAYPGGEVSSDIGHLLSVDVKRQFANSGRSGVWSVGAFFDYGMGQLAKSEWTQGATTKHTISAYGVSLDGSARYNTGWGPVNAQFGLMWAHRGMPKNSGIEPEATSRTWAYARFNI